MSSDEKIILAGFAVLLVHLYNKQQQAKPPSVYYTKTILGGFNGIAIPPIGIFIRQDQAGNQQLLNHELVHWQQYLRDGLLGFYGGYLQQHLCGGYDLNPYEVEARYEECEYCKLNYTECVRNGWAGTVHNPDFRNGK